jgi:hypothetical protein
VSKGQDLENAKLYSKIRKKVGRTKCAVGNLRGFEIVLICHDTYYFLQGSILNTI